MAGDAMEVMPMSPRQSPAGFGNAVLAWGRSRRGRMIIAAVVVILLGLMGVRHSETISAKYLSSNYHLPSWRPYLPNLPSIITSPLRPSNTTLELENGERKHVPSRLRKGTPNFHLLMNTLTDSPEFCKTTMAGTILNYPPPTVINLFQQFNSQAEREKARLKSIYHHLKNKKFVKKEDLVLIVDGEDTWFQLPSDVIIRQYQNIVADANKRLREQYGVDEKGLQKFNQTIIFGAEKVCEGDEVACKNAPYSPLPSNIYGRQTGKEKIYSPARYLDSGMVMGPVFDMRNLYEIAVQRFDSHNQAATAQSVLSTIFGEQQLARSTESTKGTSSDDQKWFSWFGGRAGTSTENSETTNATPEDDQRHEFSIGLDYTHTIFQPFQHTTEDELIPVSHDNSTDLTIYHHADTPTPILNIPTALQQARPPFWTPDLSRNDPTPENHKPTYIEPLQYQQQLDDLKPRDTSWADIALIQNTYTGAIPAIFHLKLPPYASNERRHLSSDSELVDTRRLTPRKPEARTTPTANLTWDSLWYAGYERALLRKSLRMPQSPIGAHFAAVGGDQMWDQRGGRGGVWTEKEDLWFPWGEVDGVCGTLAQLQQIFSDGKGVWLHEHEGHAEQNRVKEEKELKEKLEEARKHEEEERKKKEQERKKKIEMEEKKKADMERKKQEQEKAKAEKEMDKEEGEGEKKQQGTGEQGDGERKETLQPHVEHAETEPKLEKGSQPANKNGRRKWQGCHTSCQ
ncbi:hypothetical protein K491DRAFT_167766 [Lophiostoma macrostomum CBS 122681]|uniref:Uncharacterized protein n=1 Tax=Lophiostoma macrostomum CBS 122681 TaxID=1314788 RepID=A0A6A6STC2_9PLEO|nr:hypothetical protein K491DRAFT_167766 [Lophiostoma macrostomum CBS 122681]